MLVITRGYSIYLRFMGDIIFLAWRRFKSFWSRHLVAGFGKNPCHRFFPHKNWTFGGKPTYFQTHPRVIKDVIRIFLAYLLCYVFNILKASPLSNHYPLVLQQVALVFMHTLLFHDLPPFKTQRLNHREAFCTISIATSTDIYSSYLQLM